LTALRDWEALDTCINLVGCYGDVLRRGFDGTQVNAGQY
jgi:hypothetical protein